MSQQTVSLQQTPHKFSSLQAEAAPRLPPSLPSWPSLSSATTPSLAFSSPLAATTATTTTTAPAQDKSLQQHQALNGSSSHAAPLPSARTSSVTSQESSAIISALFHQQQQQQQQQRSASRPNHPPISVPKAVPRSSIALSKSRAKAATGKREPLSLEAVTRILSDKDFNRAGYTLQDDLEHTSAHQSHHLHGPDHSHSHGHHHGSSTIHHHRHTATSDPASPTESFFSSATSDTHAADYPDILRSKADGAYSHSSSSSDSDIMTQNANAPPGCRCGVGISDKMTKDDRAVESILGIDTFNLVRDLTQQNIKKKPFLKALRASNMSPELESTALEARKRLGARYRQIKQRQKRCPVHNPELAGTLKASQQQQQQLQRHQQQQQQQQKLIAENSQLLSSILAASEKNGASSVKANKNTTARRSSGRSALSKAQPTGAAERMQRRKTGVPPPPQPTQQDQPSLAQLQQFAQGARMMMPLAYLQYGPLAKSAFIQQQGVAQSTSSATAADAVLASNSNSDNGAASRSTPISTSTSTSIAAANTANTANTAITGRRGSSKRRNRPGPLQTTKIGPDSFAHGARNTEAGTAQQQQQQQQQMQMPMQMQMQMQMPMQMQLPGFVTPSGTEGGDMLSLPNTPTIISPIATSLPPFQTPLPISATPTLPTLTSQPSNGVGQQTITPIWAYGYPSDSPLPTPLGQPFFPMLSNPMSSTTSSAPAFMLTTPLPLTTPTTSALQPPMSMAPASLVLPSPGPLQASSTSLATSSLPATLKATGAVQGDKNTANAAITGQIATSAA